MPGYTGNMRKMSRKDTQEWRRRWRAVDVHRIKELRAMSVEEKLRQLTELMSTPVSAEWLKKREEDLKIVRERWVKLRKAYGCIE